MIKLRNVTKTYNKNKNNEVKALKNLNLDISKGEFLAIMGDSGSGKSTLLHIIAAIDDSYEGSVSFDEVDLTEMKELQLSKYRNQHIGIVLQDFALIDELTVEENTMIPLFLTRMNNGQKKEMVKEALLSVGILDLKDRIGAELSGGQKQRVSIARAIVNAPKIILCDEPTGSLDSNTANEIMDLFKHLNNQGITIVIVTHNEKVASKCKRVIYIEDGHSMDIACMEGS